MKRFVLLAAALLTAPCPFSVAEEPAETPLKVSAADWPWWRGPQRNGVAAAEPAPPLEWSDTKNVLWEAAVPGIGHGSPIVVGERVFLAFADREREAQGVLCFDRGSGARQWETVVHQGKFAEMQSKMNDKASHASSTPACDGERVFIGFAHAGAVYATALDLHGKQLWQTKISDYVMHQGYGASPAVYGPLVIVSADNKGGGAVAGLDRKTGAIVWKQDRPKTPNYASPIILNVAGREQLILTGCDLVSSFDPLSGEKLWEVKGSTTETVTSTVTDGKHVFSTGGYPDNHMAAIQADGSGKVAWQNTTRLYVPSMLERDGYLYAVTDSGIAMCLEAASGEEVWKKRLGGETSASPVLVGDKIYITNEGGATFIVAANPDKFKLLGENQLGEHSMASPAIAGGQIFLRIVRTTDGKRQETLVCVGLR